MCNDTPPELLRSDSVTSDVVPQIIPEKPLLGGLVHSSMVEDQCPDSIWIVEVGSLRGLDRFYTREDAVKRAKELVRVYNVEAVVYEAQPRLSFLEDGKTKEVSCQTVRTRTSD